MDSNFRPDDAIFIEEGLCITAWPSKLTLSPSLADKLIEHFAQNSIHPSIHSPLEALSNILEPAGMAKSYWEAE
jgi:hypothetical protein